ncbi:hypothetical protein [Microbacterium endophyticum]|nr:hypothetical protein [Microbacterium endophyticum]
MFIDSTRYTARALAAVACAFRIPRGGSAERSYVGESHDVGAIPAIASE